MQKSIKEYFPLNVKFTKPEGGMFLWAELPEEMAALDLFDIAVKDKVVFVPGDPFYINKKRANTLRLNFSCVDKKLTIVSVFDISDSELICVSASPKAILIRAFFTGFF